MISMGGRLIRTFLLIFVLVLIPFPSAFAQTFTQEMSVTPTPIAYQLPYPGLLPDHPFYFLKQFRDDVVGFFTSNALEKAGYVLHQADKRIEATMMLVDKKKNDELALATFDKAILYFEEAIEKTLAAKQQGMDITEMNDKLLDANRKHQEVTKNLVKKNPKLFDQRAKKLEELGKKVRAMQKKK